MGLGDYKALFQSAPRAVPPVLSLHLSDGMISSLCAPVFQQRLILGNRRQSSDTKNSMQADSKQGISSSAEIIAAVCLTLNHCWDYVFLGQQTNKKTRGVNVRAAITHSMATDYWYWASLCLISAIANQEIMIINMIKANVPNVWSSNILDRCNNER